MWPETAEGQNCGKPPKTVLAFANRYAAAGGVAARSGAAAQGRASAGRWCGCTGAGRGGARVQPLRGLHPVRALLRESLLELKVMGRSQRTIDWYEQKMDWYRSSGGVKNLEQLNAFELKRFLAEQHERGLSANAIHGFFQVIKSFAN